MKIGIGSDHAGFDYKEQIKKLLAGLGHEVRDFGTDSTEPYAGWSEAERVNANAISIGQRMIPLELALEIVKVWLDTPFDGGRHALRIREIDAV